jgi:hypothetical protein
MAINLSVEGSRFDGLGDTCEVGAKDGIRDNVSLKSRQSFPGRSVEMRSLDGAIDVFHRCSSPAPRSLFEKL